MKQELKSNDLFQKAFSAFVLYDPAQKKTLVNWNGHKHFTPASNTKIATLLAAIEVLGDSMSLLRYCAKGDTLFFTGSGNPVNLNPYIRQNEDFIRWLKERDQRLIYSPAKRKPAFYGPGWAWDDYMYTYQLENTAFPLYGNEIFIEGNKNALKTSPAYFQDKIIQIPEGEKRIQRSWRSNDLKVKFTERSYKSTLPMHITDTLLIALLEEKLDRPVGLVTNRRMEKPWKDLNIAMEDSLYVRLMQESDNFIAEQLLLMCAQELTDTLDRGKAIDTMIHRWRPFLVDSLRWVDGSGLSRYNLFSPYTFVQILEKIHERKGEEWIQHIFPRGGEKGTIKRWYGPFVYAKTGSLSNNHNLSGFLQTKSGKLLIFSFMHNHFLDDSASYKKEMEKILQQIHERF